MSSPCGPTIGRSQHASVGVMTTTQTNTMSKTAASARGLTRTYGRGDSLVHALRGVDVDLPAGRFTAIMGPSGSGKSTLMHCLAGLDAATSGTITVAGRDLAGLDELVQLLDFRQSNVDRKHLSLTSGNRWLTSFEPSMASRSPPCPGLTLAPDSTSAPRN